MISDKLYGLAFAYKKTKLWKKLWDTDVFAVRLSGDRIGYISIMGANGGHCALGLYTEEEGFGSFRDLMKSEVLDLSPLGFQEQLMRQESLQCAFEKKDDVSKEDQETAKAYARANKIRITGHRAYPQFVKFQPNICPWSIESKQDQEDLMEALSAAIEVARLLENQSPDELGIMSLHEGTQKVPLLERKDGAYVMGKVRIPKEKKKEWAGVEVHNQVGIASLKKAKKMGVWECEVIRCPEAVKSPEGGKPYYPLIFLAVESASEFILPVPASSFQDENLEELLDLFIETLQSQNICPKEMKVRDARTFAFAEVFCSKLQIPLSIASDLPALDDAEYLFIDRFGRSEEEGQEEAIQSLHEILELDDEKLRTLPPELVAQLESILEQGFFPEELEARFHQVFHQEGTGTCKVAEFEARKETKQSYVISVSLKPGCYRHIQISAGSTLFQMHQAILAAFGITGDGRAHTFFMDNRGLKLEECYYMEEGSKGGEQTTANCRLDQAGLEQGKKFRYLLDLGEEWVFQCKVLRVEEQGTKEPVVTRSKGEAPSQ